MDDRHKTMDHDDLRRPKFAVVVGLIDDGEGSSRLVMDDVSSANPVRETSWVFDMFYTHKRFPSSALDNMSLTVEEFSAIGQAVVARLLALNGRA
jgi:hypothetical protein